MPILESQARESQPAEFLVMEPDGGRSLPVQPKLTIGAPNDKYEQEADRVAKEVVQRLSFADGGRSPTGTVTPPQPTQPLQRESLPEDGEEFQMKPLLQRQGEGAFAASNDLESAIQQSRGSGQPLADSIREPMEQAFGGVDFRGVKVHTDGRSDQLNRAIQAKAFTTGPNIFFRKGEYKPVSRGGDELLAHELTHVVQQNGDMGTEAGRRHYEQPGPRKRPMMPGERSGAGGEQAGMHDAREKSESLDSPLSTKRNKGKTHEHITSTKDARIQRVQYDWMIAGGIAGGPYPTPRSRYKPSAMKGGRGLDGEMLRGQGERIKSPTVDKDVSIAPDDEDQEAVGLDLVIEATYNSETEEWEGVRGKTEIEITGTYDFVTPPEIAKADKMWLVEEGELKRLEKDSGRSIGHVSIAKAMRETGSLGQDLAVHYAGMITFVKGSVVEWNGASGHYLPPNLRDAVDEEQYYDERNLKMSEYNDDVHDDLPDTALVKAVEADLENIQEFAAQCGEIEGATPSEVEKRIKAEYKEIDWEPMSAIEEVKKPNQWLKIRLIVDVVTSALSVTLPASNGVVARAILRKIKTVNYRGGKSRK